MWYNSDTTQHRYKMWWNIFYYHFSHLFLIPCSPAKPGYLSHCQTFPCATCPLFFATFTRTCLASHSISSIYFLCASEYFCSWTTSVYSRVSAPHAFCVIVLFLLFPSAAAWVVICYKFSPCGWFSVLFFVNKYWSTSESAVGSRLSLIYMWHMDYHATTNIMSLAKAVITLKPNWAKHLKNYQSKVKNTF